MAQNDPNDWACVEQAIKAADEQADELSPPNKWGCHRRVFLVDTNHLSAATNPVLPVREQFYQQHRLGARFRTCIPVVCEIEVGIQDSSHLIPTAGELQQLLRKVKPGLLGTDTGSSLWRGLSPTAPIGRPMSQVDMMLAALVRQSGWILLTADRDFEALPDIRKENWLV